MRTLAPTTVTLALALSLALPAHAERLPVVVQDVLARHPDAASAQALLEASEAVVRQSRSRFFPTLSVGWTRSSNEVEQLGQPIDRDTRRSEAALSWNLFSGGADVYRLKSARNERDAAGSSLIDVQEQLALRVADAYADVLRLQRINAGGKALSQSLTHLKSQVEARVDAGRISPADLTQVDVSIIESEEQVASLDAALAAALMRYEQLTGTAPDALVPPAFDALDFSRAARLQATLDNNPGLRAARQGIDARKADVGVARGALMPTVDVEVRRRLGATIEPVEVSDTVRSQQLAINLDVPLGGGSWYRVDEANARHRAAVADAASLEEQLSIDVATQVAELGRRESTYQALTRRLGASRTLIDAYGEQFNAGRRSLTDVLSAHRGRFDAVLAHANSEYERFRAQATLLALSGDLRTALTESYRDREYLAAAPAPVTPADTPSRVDTPDTERVKTLLEAWRLAWSSKDYDAYRGLYLTEFGGGGDATRQWERERERRLAKPGAIDVEIGALTVSRPDASTIVTVFQQNYRSNDYNDAVTKQLTWTREADQWRIADEQSSP
ncbi:TolC family protein [Nitrogeniibacter aestuarii]|uniref:TolC family protein n=1 Tax=Nitrogeniibacter aestuarii TaxID=2815343 RepID=UPI001D10AC06|nr:TolC family protein [Nitrogeniibacter aestuarii]